MRSKRYILKILFVIVTMLLMGNGNSYSQTTIIPDANLYEFIRSKFPTTITTSGRLNISEAAKIRGNFICKSRNIRSAEGIQYFTRLSHIDLGYNQLTAVPPLNNDSLEYLELNNNYLTTLPVLTNIKKLKHLDLSYNNLSSLPKLNSLKKLEVLLCAHNLLSELPLMDSLKYIYVLDASYNSITTFPKLPSSISMYWISLNNNLLTSLPDTLPFAKLPGVYIYQNKLTFKELNKFTFYPGFDTLLRYSPQSIIPVGKSVTVKELEKEYLATGVDRDIPDITYHWYKDGKYLKSTSRDTLFLPSVSFLDSGKYTCKIEYPMLSKLILETDNYFLRVNPCIEPTNFSISTTSIDCKRTGTLTINATQNSTSGILYTLKSPVTEHSFTSNTGFFNGLPEPLYKLSFSSENGCKKDYPYDIKILKEECKQALITPNNDGENEGFFFTQKGVVTIFDKQGNRLKSLSIPNEWDGTAKSGRVAPGYYIADINNGEEVITISVVY